MFDVKPTFPIPQQWQRHTLASTVGQTQGGSWARFRKIWRTEFQSEPQWANLLEEMAGFSHTSFAKSSSVPNRSIVDHLPGDDGVWTSSMIHKLLSFSPSQGLLASPLASQMQASLRLGCLLYMVPVWRFFGVAPVVSDTLLANLRSVLEKGTTVNTTTDPWGRLWPMALWTLYMGAMEALDGPLEAWFVDRLVSFCQSHGVHSWGQLVDNVQNVLWFACLFDRKHTKLRERIESKPKGGL